MAKDYDVQALQPNAGANLSVPLDSLNCSKMRYSGILGDVMERLTDRAATAPCSLQLLHAPQQQRTATQMNMRPSAAGSRMPNVGPTDLSDEHGEESKPLTDEEFHAAIGVAESLLAECSSATVDNECGSSGSTGSSNTDCVREAVAKALLQLRGERTQQQPIEAQNYSLAEQQYSLPHNQRNPHSTMAGLFKPRGGVTEQDALLLQLLQKLGGASAAVCEPSRIANELREAYPSIASMQFPANSCEAAPALVSAAATGSTTTTTVTHLPVLCGKSGPVSANPTLSVLQPPSSISSGHQQHLQEAAAMTATAAESIGDLPFGLVAKATQPGCASTASAASHAPQLYSFLELQEQGQVQCGDQQQLQNKQQSALPLAWINQAAHSDVGDFMCPLGSTGLGSTGGSASSQGGQVPGPSSVAALGLADRRLSAPSGSTGATPLTVPSINALGICSAIGEPLKQQKQQQARQVPSHQGERISSRAEEGERLKALINSMWGEGAKDIVPFGLTPQELTRDKLGVVGGPLGAHGAGRDFSLSALAARPAEISACRAATEIPGNSAVADRLISAGGMQPKLRGKQLPKGDEGDEMEVESANRKLGELRPACCYFLLGKCEFSRSCVFWHPPPEAEPSLVVCKYGRVCNAQHGHRVSYKELAAVVHAFVRRCPQLAPGESGRLYHYLRVSRSQPQQHMKQLSGRPPPALPPYIIHHFYRLLDSVQGRDLSAVNSVWRRTFGEPFPYAVFGFEQLRAAIASIPGVQLTTRGTNVIVSTRSKEPNSHEKGAILNSLASADSVVPLRNKYTAQAIQQTDSCRMSLLPCPPLYHCQDLSSPSPPGNGGPHAAAPLAACSIGAQTPGQQSLPEIPYK
ncbi:zinc finger (CCCH type) protein, putative [Eimeria tenella]|uniref:Zinc finger (CCCH type) protein, putative n=1 Tax=Eimeria tenella TaxID=5802 RepID=U6KRX8_EIMTE|nr:zinc finger (CCCH type) protein, putative [Eimeria tenella]CDJ40726.1 zinc finger (CCCH type) protein, putative [Eimeria tenella]|eukprot:XP_013231476.1 zinc finger (CCCH type) protein, putative [Eimeria tenella]